ncbi:MAG TPA: 4-carboxymuconolactone decarboxylase [Gemmatirosa sp.]
MSEHGSDAVRNTAESDGSRYDAGMRVRRAVLGDAHVDRAQAAQTAFDAPFQRFITETAWGTLWAGDGLDRRTRSLVTIAILAALGRQEELTLHLRASRNTGATSEEIREALLHVAVYAGVPAANSAIAIARTILTPDGAGAEAGAERADGSHEKSDDHDDR